MKISTNRQTMKKKMKDELERGKTLEKNVCENWKKRMKAQASTWMAERKGEKLEKRGVFSFSSIKNSVLFCT